MDMHAGYLDAELAFLLHEPTTPPAGRRRRDAPPPVPKDAPRPGTPPARVPEQDDVPMPTSEVEDRYWDWIERPN